MNCLTKNSNQLFKKLNECQRTDRHVNEVRKTIHKQNVRFKKEIKIIKKEPNRKFKT